MKFLIQRNLLFVFLLLPVLSCTNDTDTQVQPVPEVDTQVEQEPAPVTQPADPLACNPKQLQGSWTIYYDSEEHLGKDHNGDYAKLKIKRTDGNQFELSSTPPWQFNHPFTGSCDENLPVISGTVILHDGCLHKLTITRMTPGGACVRRAEADNYGRNICLTFDFAENVQCDADHHDGDVRVQHPGDAHGGDDKEPGI